MRTPARITTVLLLALCCSMCTREASHPPLPEALAALVSTAAVDYECVAVPQWHDAAYHLFSPAGGAADTGLIFYAGSGIDVRAYAPSAQAIAAAGFLVALVSMPNQTALLAPDRAAVVIDACPGISAWAIGGHSMGGIAACDFAARHTDLIDAVVLWASKPTAPNRLDSTGLSALSVSATNDGIYPPEVIDATIPHLPADTVWVVIDGGNHYQFGWYADDHQPVDGEATISREHQLAQAQSATSAFLADL